MNFANGPGARNPKSEELDVVFATASMTRGTLIDAGAAGGSRDQLESLAATLPELFGTVDRAALDRISERLGGNRDGRNFAEILLLSEHHLHVIQPLETRPEVALLAISPATQSVGLVLSFVHAQVAQLEQR